MFERILLATDGSEHSERSAQHAAQLAEKFNGTVDVVYVIDGARSKEDVLHNDSKYEIELKRKEITRRVEEVFEDTNTEYDIHFLHGEPGPTIVQFANENDYNCLVIGSRGHNQFQKMILGSVSHKVAKRVQCPVVIVK